MLVLLAPMVLPDLQVPQERLAHLDLPDPQGLPEMPVQRVLQAPQDPLVQPEATELLVLPVRQDPRVMQAQQEAQALLAQRDPQVPKVRLEAMELQEQQARQVLPAPQDQMAAMVLPDPLDQQAPLEARVQLVRKDPQGLPVPQGLPELPQPLQARLVPPDLADLPALPEAAAVVTPLTALLLCPQAKENVGSMPTLESPTPGFSTVMEQGSGLNSLPAAL